MYKFHESYVRKKGDDEEAMRIWDCGSPLYDSYELVALTNIIERKFMIFPNYLSGSRKAAAFPPPPPKLVADEAATAMKRRRKKKKEIGMSKLFFYVKSLWKKLKFMKL
ncbi:hypothetical protein CASFOL_041361 [Castilleja foliolosa]|uniref:Uncharacterized protein n=1 Tax=Castilleja foliolosa TaxID=1961234 RepID=A0ABD3BFY2_9LAMI